MKCIICGRTEIDFEKRDTEIIEKIDNALEILNNKIRNDIDRKQVVGITKEIDMLNQLKATLGKVCFVDTDISNKVLNNSLLYKCNFIMGKYVIEEGNRKDDYIPK
jgi:hypothetical protein